MQAGARVYPKRRRTVWMKRKLKKKPFEKELRAGDTQANIKEEGSISKKIQHKHLSLALMHAKKNLLPTLMDGL